jgi:hypothetical protein
MTTKDFDWYGASESVVVRHQPAIAIYLNPYDEVVVRQQGQYDEDQWVYVSTENVPILARAMLEAAGYETDQTYGKPLPKPEPLSGAERQRRYRNKRRNGERNADVTEEPQLRLVAAE